MDWNTKLQDIIDYVENHLQRDQEPIKQEEIAQLAGCSIGFFQKVFSYMYGISFAEYVRSRKLTLAGYDLKSTNLRVIDISYRYGYDSPTSFTKAFQQFHGITPTQARNIDAQLRVIPKMQIALKQRYTWSIKQKPEGRDFHRVPAVFWQVCRYVHCCVESSSTSGRSCCSRASNGTAAKPGTRLNTSGIASSGRSA